MYSAPVVLRNLEAFHQHEGWMPVYHSIADVEEFSAYVDSITVSSSNSRSTETNLNRCLPRKRVKEIMRWVQNEQALCCYDAKYFLSRYAFINDNKGNIRRFSTRLAQDVFLSMLDEFDEGGTAIELLVLKARQQGVSTLVALLFLHRLLFIPHTNAVMASVENTKSELLARMMETCLERLPWWLIPRRTTDRIAKQGFSNGSILSIQSGSQGTGIAQGWTPTCLTRGTLIRVSDGVVKPIDEVAPGDLVITHRGELKPVKVAFKTSRIAQPTKIIKLRGNHAPMELTLDHRVCTPGGWIEAKDLTAGDFVCHPVRKFSQEVTSFEMFRYPRGKICESRREYFSLDVTPQLGYLCGIYLAEGTIHETKKANKCYISEVWLTVHETQIDRTVAAVTAVLGKQQYIHQKHKGNHGGQVKFGCAWLAKWIAEHFGRVRGKHVPDWAFLAGQAFCSELLRGYLDADGHLERKSNNVVAPSIHYAIVCQMRDLVASLGMGWASIYKRKNSPKTGGKMSDTWVLALTGPCGHEYRKRFGYPIQRRMPTARHWEYTPDAESVSIEIESIKDGFAEDFWDIEVADDDHSFTTTLCSVHNCVHISEIGDIPNPQKVIEEGLLRATHATRKLFQVYEGTGNGNTGWLADKWRAAKEDWPLGKSRLCPMFISWPLAPDQYPEADWLKKFPVPEGFSPLEITRRHVRRCELYIRNTPYLAKICGAQWKMPSEQQWYWQFHYLEAVKTHTEKIWFSQMPADDYEALQGKNDSVFAPDTIEFVTEQRKRTFQDYAIVGDTIDGFEPNDEDIDYEKERVIVKWTSHRGQTYDWTMIPLIFNETEKDTDDRKAIGRIRVFEEPKADVDYSVGIDTADGLGHENEDRSVLSITRNASGEGCDEQVCEFVHNLVNSPQMVGFAACLGAWYGERTRDARGVKFAIEQRERAGDDCQLQLKLMGFHHHHVATRYDDRVVKENKGSKQGWYTNSWSRPLLMNRFVDAVNNGWYIPHSRWLIQELGSLERKTTVSGKTRLEHQSGKHDDRVMAAAMSYFTYHALDVMADRSMKRYNPPAAKLPQLSYQYSTVNQLSVGA